MMRSERRSTQNLMSMPARVLPNEPFALRHSLENLFQFHVIQRQLAVHLVRYCSTLSERVVLCPWEATRLRTNNGPWWLPKGTKQHALQVEQ